MRMTRHQRYLQCLNGYVLIPLGTYRPANHAARVQIEQHSQRQLAAPSCEGSEVSFPDSICRGGHEDLLQPVWRRLGKQVLFCQHPEPPYAASCKPVQSAQSRDSVSATHDSRREQYVPHFDAPVARLGLPMKLLYVLNQVRVGSGPRTGRLAPPCVFNSFCHLYGWLRRGRNSQATTAAGRPGNFQSRIASCLNSVVNCCRFAIRYLYGLLSTFESAYANRASSDIDRR